MHIESVSHVTWDAPGLWTPILQGQDSEVRLWEQPKHNEYVARLSLRSGAAINEEASHLPSDQVLHNGALVFIHDDSETLDFLNVCHFAQRDDLYSWCCRACDLSVQLLPIVLQMCLFPCSMVAVWQECGCFQCACCLAQSFWPKGGSFSMSA